MGIYNDVYNGYEINNMRWACLKVRDSRKNGILKQASGLRSNHPVDWGQFSKSTSCTANLSVPNQWADSTGYGIGMYWICYWIWSWIWYHWEDWSPVCQWLYSNHEIRQSGSCAQHTISTKNGGMGPQAGLILHQQMLHPKEFQPAKPSAHDSDTQSQTVVPCNLLVTVWRKRYPSMIKYGNGKSPMYRWFSQKKKII